MTEKFENILEKCLERITVKGESIEACLSDYPEHASRLEPLLRTAISASSCVQPIQAAPELKLKARNRMLSEIQGRQQKRVKVRTFAWKYRWALPALLLLLLLISSGVVIGANDSMPGEPLYSVKTTMEKIQLKLTPSDLDKAKLHVKFAERRAEEMVEMNKSNKTQEVEKLALRVERELNRTVLLTESMKSEKGWEKKVEKIRKKLQNSNVLTSSEGLSDEPLYPVKIAVEDTLLKIAPSGVSRAELRIEFAEQRVQKIVEISQNDNSEKLDELLQSAEQHLGNLDILAGSLLSQGGRETEVEEITGMLENAATRNLNMFNERLRTATVQAKPALERVFKRLQMCYDEELESLNKIKQTKE